MSGSVVALVTPGTVYPSDRVRDFICLAKSLSGVLVSDKEWDSNVWEVGQHFNTKGQNRSKRLVAYYKWGCMISPQQLVVGDPFHPAYIEFAKAYYRYMHSTAPVQFENQSKRLEALRLIEAAFCWFSREPSIEQLDVIVLNKAVELARDGVGPSRHYQLALYIQQVHSFCLKRLFLNAPFQWKHGVRKPKDKTEEIGAEAKAWRESKLPSPEAFHGLAHIFRNASRFDDLLFSAVCAICASIPIRAHEVLQLRLDCEVNGRTKSEAGEEIDTYGIRVWPGKGHPAQVKWVPTIMVDLVKQAIQRLRGLSKGPRYVAAWYEKHPGVLWLPERAECFRVCDNLPLAELTKIVIHQPNESHSGPNLTARWARQLGIKNDANGRNNPLTYVGIGSMAEILLRTMPADFPFFNGDKEQLYSESLIVIFDNSLSTVPIPFVVSKVGVDHFNRWLAGHDGGKQPSAFKRWEIKERDGSDIEITTHSFRHWLNTVAQFRGLGELDIAKWSGRDVAQNKAYDHVSPEEVLTQIREAMEDGNAIGPMFEAAKMQGVNKPVDRKEFAKAQIGSALVSDYGICVHDYSLLPCQNHGDCLGCSENVFIKGDVKHRMRVETRLSMAENQLDDARAAMDQEYYGADRWTDAHERSIEQMRSMLATHDDPAIPNGTIINLATLSDNSVAMAIRDRDAAIDANGRVALTDKDEDFVGRLPPLWEDV